MSRQSYVRCDAVGCASGRNPALWHTLFRLVNGWQEQLDLCMGCHLLGYWLCHLCWKVHKAGPCPAARAKETP